MSTANGIEKGKLDRTYAIFTDADNGGSKQVTVHAPREEIIRSLVEHFDVRMRGRPLKTTRKPKPVAT